MDLNKKGPILNRAFLLMSMSKLLLWIAKLRLNFFAF